MQKRPTNTNPPITVDILIFDQFSNHCLANCVEPLRAANTLSGHTLYAWRYLTPEGRCVTSSSGLSILPDDSAAPSTPADFVFVISSYGYLSQTTPQTGKLLRDAARHATVIGFDTGAWLMAAAGLLDGKSATIHWDTFDAFSERFLDVDTQRERFILHPSIGTCGGATAAFDLALHLIAAHHGPALRLDVAALFDGMHSTGTTPPVRGRSFPIRAALSLMRDSFEAPLPLAQIAEAVGLHPKTLHRRFLSELGAPPGQIYRHLRLSAARDLIASTELPVAEIAIRAGYEDASAMTRAFKSRFGRPPMAYRRKAS